MEAGHRDFLRVLEVDETGHLLFLYKGIGEKQLGNTPVAPLTYLTYFIDEGGGGESE